ncbi:MAG: hypothetical protein GF334_13625 [Candidatus Altiarchaeales archaeon]|nr:hypothetical protein [Candidatus Altiarchaeales archaeon]
MTDSGDPKRRVVERITGSSPEEGLREGFMWRSSKLRQKAGEDKSLWGFNLSFDGQGKPKISEFGLRPEDKHTVHSGASEPLAEVFDRGDYVSVVLEVPAVDREEIDLVATELELKVKVKNESNPQVMKMKLPLPVIPSSANAVLKNGVLEVKILKKQ